MSTSFGQRLRAALNAMPSVQKNQQRASFKAIVRVQMSDWSRLDAASGLIYSNQMVGLTRRRLNMRDDQVLWEFEEPDDAVLFMLWFGGVIVR